MRIEVKRWFLVKFIIIPLIVILAFGIPLYIMGATFFGLGKYSPIFNGGKKTYFRGVANTKYKKDKIEIKEAKNLNGELRKTLKVKALENYKINCNITKEKGDVLVKFSDRDNNLLGKGNETIKDGINYSCDKNGRIIVEMNFDKFQGQVIVELVKV